MGLEIDKIWKGWKEDSYIGGGAFGKVYKITKEEFGHTYEAALKVISIPQNSSEIENVTMEGMDEEGVTEYFYKMTESIVKEVQLMSELKGITNIVSYEEHEILTKEDGIGWDIYIRMELLKPLLTYLNDHPQLSRSEIIQLGIDICTALEICQKHNIIHRDIKPENIFVSKNGDFKLGDFGIARQLEKTSSGLSQKGTYTYMAPEVIKGLPYNATVDIYSLGIVMYRFLNKNRAPFMPPYPEKIFPDDRENANIMRISGETFPKPCDADEALSAVVLKACAYEPADRYSNPTELKKALQNVLLSEIAINPLNEIKKEVLEQDATVALNCATNTAIDPEETIPPEKLQEEIVQEQIVQKEIEESIVPEEKEFAIVTEQKEALSREQLNESTEKTVYMGNIMPVENTGNDPQQTVEESEEIFESLEESNIIGDEKETLEEKEIVEEMDEKEVTSKESSNEYSKIIGTLFVVVIGIAVVLFVCL